MAIVAEADEQVRPGDLVLIREPSRRMAGEPGKPDGKLVSVRESEKRLVMLGRAIYQAQFPQELPSLSVRAFGVGSLLCRVNLPVASSTGHLGERQNHEQVPAVDPSGEAEDRSG